MGDIFLFFLESIHWFKRMYSYQNDYILDEGQHIRVCSRCKGIVKIGSVDCFIVRKSKKMSKTTIKSHDYQK